MPLIPIDDSARTRNQRRQEEERRIEEQARRQENVDQRRFGERSLEDVSEPPTDPAEETEAPAAAAAAPAAFDMAALMTMLQEQGRRQEEQARRQEEQVRRQEEQARRQEEQARRQEERHAEQILLVKNLQTTIGTQLEEVKEKVKDHETRLFETEAQIADVRKTLHVLKTENKVVTSVAAAPISHGFKVPPFDGTSSWSAYQIQFDAIVGANGWNEKQAMTALTVALRDQALTVLDALGKNVTYEKLLETLENRYGDKHLEHAYRAKLNDRSQRRDENIQEWALEAEKMVRKAYQSSPVLINERLVEVFANGIRSYDVRTAVKLGHHKTLKDALAHALEEEAVREDQRATQRIREVKGTSSSFTSTRPGPRCYNCNERGHIRRNCPKPLTRRDEQPVEERADHGPTQQQGKRVSARTAGRVLAGFEKAPRIQVSQEFDFTTEHRSGRSHGNADALSRRPCPEDCKHCVRQEAKETIPVKMLRTDLSDEWKETLQTAQQEDDDIKPIFEWIESGATKPNWSDIAKMSVATKSYWAQWDSLVIHEGVLCRKWENTRGNHCHLQMIVPRAKVPDILHLYHEGYSGGHLGVKRTLLKIRERFYWINCRDDVEDWVRKCTTCAAVKGPHTRSRGALKLYNVGAPWERIALDVAGPFPISDSGNKYFLVVMDYFTKWPEVFAIPNQEASTVADKLVHEVFCRFGVPLEIHSDQGRNFESQLFQEMCRVMGTHKTRTTSYHPQSDGMVERFNQTLERYLAKVVENKQRDWDKHIQPFLLSYRSAVHESTNVTPAFANFGRELRLPADLITGIPPDSPQTITDYASDLRTKMNDIYEHVRHSGQHASEKMKTRYDRKLNHPGFDEGSLVWLHNPVRSKGKSPKLQPKWDGPYRVLTKINDVTFRIQKGQRGAPKIVHVDRLARYCGSNDARDEHVLGGGSVTPA